MEEERLGRKAAHENDAGRITSDCDETSAIKHTLGVHVCVYNHIKLDQNRSCVHVCLSQTEGKQPEVGAGQGRLHVWNLLQKQKPENKKSGFWVSPALSGFGA